MNKITFVLLSCGELSESKCLDAISQFRNEIDFIEIRNLFPQVVALNQMIEMVQTDYFVPLDADIVLKEDAFFRIKRALLINEANEQWHSILFPLWDVLTQRRILALKLMRTKVMKNHLFLDVPTPDVEHYQRLTKNGFKCITEHLKEPEIGDHIVAGKKFCYFKYRDVYQTLRAHNFEWDSGAFLGGFSLREKAKCHFDYFLYRYLTTCKLDYLHCIAGMMDGILSPQENKSKTLDTPKYQIKSKHAIDRFFRWYSQHTKDSGYLIF